MPLSKIDEQNRARLPIVVSQGEPSGIGPEIAVKAWIRLNGMIAGRPIRLVGSASHFRETATRLGYNFDGVETAVVDTGLPVEPDPGHPSSTNAPAVTAAIEQCVAACLEQRAAAMVTAPIQKSVLTEAGFGFPGHTEYLAALTGAGRAVMMLASSGIDPPLRVVPFTIHIPLRNVFRELNATAISETARIILESLATDFGISGARLAIAGVNPHAGESGTMGREEIEVITPAIIALRNAGYHVDGPMPADTMFHDAARRAYDAALCMFHDQALIPIKTLDFRCGVNVTLGLPIIRTSPDHGTALDIAGRGMADESSLVAAITMAAEIATRRGL
jgi:4-hydroxythreonine-4-phosphate dehydrogenase